MGKREGYILERIADMDNLRAADRAAQMGKNNRHIRRHNAHAEEELLLLQHWILNPDEFPPPQFSMMEVRNENSAKTRTIARQNYFPWRILPHAIMNVIGQKLWNSLIADSFACVPGKGLHYGVRRMKMMLRRYPEYRWYWKTDYKKFYLSILHVVIMDAFRRKFKDKRFLHLLEVAVFNYDSGQEIVRDLYAEQQKSKRSNNRRVFQPTVRELCEE